MVRAPPVPGGLGNIRLDGDAIFALRNTRFCARPLPLASCSESHHGADEQWPRRILLYLLVQFDLLVQFALDQLNGRYCMRLRAACNEHTCRLRECAEAFAQFIEGIHERFAVH